MAATSSEKPTAAMQDTVDTTSDARKTDEPATGGMKPFLRIFTFGTPMDTIFQIIGGLCAIGSGTALPLMSIVFGSFVTGFTDFGSGRSSPADFRKDVNKLTLWFVYLFIGKFVLSYVSTALFMISALRITSRIRSLFVKATLRQEIGYFDDVGPGSIAVKATTNANQIKTGIAEKFSKLIQSLSMIATALIVGLTQSWKLSLIITAAVFPLFLILSITMTYDANIEVEVLRIYSKASNLAEEILGSIKTVRAFEANAVLLKKYDGWLVKATSASDRRSKVYAIMFGGDFFFGYMPYALAFWQGARMYLTGDLASVGKLITVVFSVLMISAGIGQVAPAITSFIQASSAANDLFQTLDRKPLLDSSADTGDKLSEVNGHIEFQNVSFSYPSRPHIPILKGISFDVPANKTTALVGASGSGKSTVVSLLERWYEPGNGDILVDGHKINELNVKWLRNNMRLVQQEPVLFNDTIFNNIIQGLSGSEHESAPQDVKMKLVKEACRAANAADFIEELDEGYHTHVGERAGLLSGGQKQRIAIARSIISNPRILLLDEATSALDAHSEGIVQNALDRVSKFRTTIVIAHKLATVMKADNIIVLGQGEILEQGTHQNLLERNGAYATLVHAQQLGNSLSAHHEDEESVDDSLSVKDVQEVSMENKITTVKSWSQTHPDSFGSKDLSLLRILITFVGENGKHWRLYAVVVFFSIIGGGIYPAQAVLLSKLIVAFELPRDKIQKDVNFWALMFFILSLAALVAYGILGWTTNVISQVLTKRYRYEMLESLMRQDISFFDRPENAGATLASRLSTDPAGLQDLVGMNIALIVVVIVNLVSNAILAIVYGWKLALVVFFGALPLIFFAGVIRIRLESQLDSSSSAAFADSARFASEAVGAMRTVCSFTIEDSVSAAYDERLQVSLRKSIKHVFPSLIFYALTESIQFLGMALAFWYGGGLLASGEYTTSQFFVIYTAIIFGGEAAAMFFSWTTNIVKAHSGGNYILKLRHSRALISSDSNAKQPDPKGDYTFDKIHFRYPLRKNVPVLQGLDLKIKSGTSVAFVGGSGCGKSTTIGLLERYYDPSYGGLQFGGEYLPDLQLSEYRSLISLVSQEPTLYQGSIRENIALGATGPVTEEQIVNAAKEANIIDFISSLPEGLATDCGSRGMQLSGGQKQRIAIARALVRDPKVMLLDEATSALDTTSEKLVQESLNNASRGRTTISVAHRLSTIRDCDKIFVFDGGVVAESGTHQELLALNGRYKKLCEAQSLDQSS